MNRPLILTAAALLLVLADAATASATTVLPSGSVLTGTSSLQYTYTTSHPYWSVTAVQPTTGSEYFLALDDKNGNQLQESTYGTGLTNFIAVDSNAGTEPYQSYFPFVNAINAGKYWVQAQYGSTEVSIPTPTHQGTTGFADPDISFMNLNSNNVVSIADIYLTAGQSFWASTPVAANELFLLEADPSYSTTFIQNRVDATLRQKTKVIDNCTLYTASVTGWHALVMIGDTPPVATNPQQGIAFGLHQYDATNPNYCPMADFPGATPAP
ncbi:MAG TPA: hypothetical protein VFN97_03615 [Actinospica sp.]|nr:hypothetical protein [Actinospica sp.]